MTLRVFCLLFMKLYPVTLISRKSLTNSTLCIVTPLGTLKLQRTGSYDTSTNTRGFAPWLGPLTLRITVAVPAACEKLLMLSYILTTWTSYMQLSVATQLYVACDSLLYVGVPTAVESPSWIWQLPTFATQRLKEKKITTAWTGLLTKLHKPKMLQ